MSCGYVDGRSAVRSSAGRSVRDVVRRALGSRRFPSELKSIFVRHGRSRQGLTPAATRTAHSARSGPHKCLIRIGKSKSFGERRVSNRRVGEGVA
jgi:hypothetical protein